MGNKINLDDFDTMVFDDGVPIEEKQKIQRAYENSAKIAEENQKNQGEKQSYVQNNDEGFHGNSYVQKEQQKPRELSETETKQKLEELKTQQNLKSISSDAFKDTSAE